MNEVFKGFSLNVEKEGIDLLVTFNAEVNFNSYPIPKVRIKPGETLVVGQGETRQVITNHYDKGN